MHTPAPRMAGSQPCRAEPRLGERMAQRLAWACCIQHRGQLESVPAGASDPNGASSWAARPAHRDASSLQTPGASGRRCRAVLALITSRWGVQSGEGCGAGEGKLSFRQAAPLRWVCIFSAVVKSVGFGGLAHACCLPLPLCDLTLPWPHPPTFPETLLQLLPPSRSEGPLLLSCNLLKLFPLKQQTSCSQPPIPEHHCTLL